MTKQISRPCVAALEDSIRDAVAAPWASQSDLSLAAFFRRNGAELSTLRERGVAVSELVEMLAAGGIEMTPRQFSARLSAAKSEWAGGGVKIDSVPPTRPLLPRGRLVKADLIRGLAPMIDSMRALGLTWDEIAARLSGAGLSAGGQYVKATILAAARREPGSRSSAVAEPNSDLSS